MVYDPFDLPRDGGSTLMQVNGLQCTLHMPPAVTSRHSDLGDEMNQSLPPYAQRTAYSVADYDEHCPEDWKRGDANSTSCFVAVKPEHGLWLDFNGNRNHPHDVAVVVSSQGLDALTRQKSSLRLEQYRNRCPKHDLEFGEGRLCKECGYKWPPQNYLASNVQGGRFWLDGFRADDGTIRQFVFTEETARGVAAQVLGDERVFSIGIAFFLSKQPKPPPPQRVSRFDDNQLEGLLGGGSYNKAYGSPVLSSSPRGRSRQPIRRATVASAPMEIAAGARINQRVELDPNEPDYWQATPAGIIYINYTDEATAREILSHGRRAENRDGPLAGLRVGHGVGQG